MFRCLPAIHAGSLIKSGLLAIVTATGAAPLSPYGASLGITHCIALYKILRKVTVTATRLGYLDTTCRKCPEECSEATWLRVPRLLLGCLCFSKCLDLRRNFRPKALLRALLGATSIRILSTARRFCKWAAGSQNFDFSYVGSNPPVVRGRPARDNCNMFLYQVYLHAELASKVWRELGSRLAKY